jgi:hypothetical protein
MNFRTPAMLLLVASSAAFSQVTISTSTNYVATSFLVPLSAPFQPGVSIAIAYNANLSPSSYVTQTQLTSDIVGFLASYPTPTDPPEAILSSMLSSVLQKYPQINGGTLFSTFLGHSVEVFMGNLGGSQSQSALVEKALHRAAAGYKH